MQEETDMYELVQVSEKCYYINCPAKIGVYVADQDNVCKGRRDAESMPAA